MTTLRHDYEVRTQAGTLALTASEPDIAITWAKNNSANRGPLTVEEVTVTEERRVISKAPVRLRRVA